MEQNTLNTALLVMDMQAFILKNLKDGGKEIISNVSRAIKSARENEIPVIYVKVVFRPGMPEVSVNNKAFYARKEFWNAMTEEWMQVEPAIAPLSGDITVNKRRVSAFTGSDLEVILRALGIQHIVLCGVATSGVVLSTLREAADKDYRITVLSDCCADAEDEVHSVLMTKVFPRQADILRAEEWSKV